MRLRPSLLILATGVPLLVGTLLSGGGQVAATDRVIVVVAGDTLSGIATRVGVPVETLAALNDLPDVDHIVVGQRLRIKARPARTHRVAPGETLSLLAQRYGTSVTAIARANGIADPSFVPAGAVLRIPGTRAGADTPAGADLQQTAEPASRPITHRVAPGETLSLLAQRYGTSVTAIARANGIADPSFVPAGAVLRIPGTRADDGLTPTSGLPAQMAEAAAERSGVRRLIVTEARRQGVPAALALAVAWQESGWQQDVRSYAGAVGVMQLLPATADWVQGSILHEPIDLWSAASNVRAGVALLDYYLARYGGDRTRALAAYYQGMTATDRHGVYPVTRPYVASILALEHVFGG
jgi:LysM repeat protein